MTTLPRIIRVAGCLLSRLPGALWAQTETFVQTVGADTPRTFAHLSLPGATGIDFSLSIAIAPTYPETESHILVPVSKKRVAPPTMLLTLSGLALHGPVSVGPHSNTATRMCGSVSG